MIGRLAPGPLLEAHGTRVIGAVQRNAEGEIDVESLVLPLTGRDGAVKAWCLAVPFLRPGDVPRMAAEDGADHARAMRFQQRAGGLQPPRRIVVAGDDDQIQVRHPFPGPLQKAVQLLLRRR